eukprot:TRINITY_DN9272_c0_g1_i2.p1 TRINITY_DN9272_c0_g1~~TRINITY_DN9272_c0_g1_i2.p1  ORF type:complete len:1006 (-),score=213.10 TRINITY_DN9272_c0_g1_i2:64-3081(-)
MYVYVFGVVMMLLQGCFSIYPADEVYLTEFNLTYALKDESYVFNLNPVFEVPNQLVRHTIYTASTTTTVNVLKRALEEIEGDVEISHIDHQLLNEVVGDLPKIRVSKKRDIAPVYIAQGIRSVRFSPKLAVFAAEPSKAASKKRGVSIEVGSSLCVTSSLSTTCNNAPDLSTVKTAIKGAVDEIYTELDSYKKTNDARQNMLTSALEAQAKILTQMVNVQSQINYMAAEVSRQIAINAVQMADGDFQLHSQINYLKRVTHSLLKFYNSLASTDPRAVVAQPSLSELFQGYVLAIDYFSTNLSYVPIIDSANEFTWTETTLPTQSVKNVQLNPCLEPDAPLPCALTSVLPPSSFIAVKKYSCSNPNLLVPSCPAANENAEANNFIYGPFHKAHYGLYPIYVTNSNMTSYVMRPVVSSAFNSFKVSASIPRLPYCTNFLGFKSLTSFADANDVNGPSMVNGPNPATDSDCDNLRLVSTDSSLGRGVYSLYGETEGIVVPFYSNCNAATFKSEVAAHASSVPSSLSSVDYICSNTWTQTTANPVASVCSETPSLSISSVTKYQPNYDTLYYHWVSPNCYMNIEPTWIELEYYVPPNNKSIPNIPRGFQLNQFTINPYGELASSLEFLYTDRWAQVYTINRISTNHLVADEITSLEGKEVLFYIDPVNDMVTDAADSFFGIGNNGRDCIHRYNFQSNLFNCYYQNDNALETYPSSAYRTGSLPTTGIAKYVSKFYFTLDITPTGLYQFTLSPKPDADFSYSIEMNGNVCPRLVSQTAKTSGCSVSLQFTRTDTQVQMVGAKGTKINVSFNNTMATVGLSFDTWTVKAGTKQCYILSCSFTSQFSTVKLDTPNVQLVTAADLALNTKVALSISDTIKTTVDTMNSAVTELDALNQNLTQIKKDIASLDFNVSKIFPYQDFTKMREQVYALIDQVPVNNATSSSTSSCTSPWSSASCFFEDFASTLVTVALCLVVGGLLLLGAKKAGVFKGKKHNKSKSQSPQAEVQHADL